MIKRVQDLLTARRTKRFERQARRFTPEGRAARTEAQSRQDSGFGAGHGGAIGGPPVGGP
jgi:hypothetical protein